MRGIIRAVFHNVLFFFTPFTVTIHRAIQLLWELTFIFLFDTLVFFEHDKPIEVTFTK